MYFFSSIIHYCPRNQQSALIQNAHTILYQSISLEYFGVNPPLLDHYFT